jgi:hypothetical protein
MNQRPNILWISFEDTFPFYGCYGDKAARPPNLDRLAAEGCRGPNAFSTAGVCAAGISQASLLQNPETVLRNGTLMQIEGGYSLRTAQYRYSRSTLSAVAGEKRRIAAVAQKQYEDFPLAIKTERNA